MEDQSDRFIAAVDQTAFDQSSSETLAGHDRSDQGYLYRQALSQRMGLGGSVFQYDPNQASSTNRREMDPVGWDWRAPSPPPQSGERTPQFSSPSMGVDAYSPPEATPGEYNSNGQSTPRKQMGGFSNTFNSTRSPLQQSPEQAMRFHTPTQSITQSPVMRTPVQRIENSTSPFASPGQQPRPPTPQAASTWLPPSLTRSPQPPASASKKRDGMTPSKILDAKGISDDLDSSVLAWGSHYLFIGLGTVAYMWCPEEVKMLFEAHSEITSIACSSPQDEDDYVAVGLANGLIHYFIFDSTENIQSFPPIREHNNVKVTSLALNRHTLYSSTDDGVFSILDLRSQSSWRTSLECDIYKIAVTPDGNHVALGTDFGVTVFHSSNLTHPTTVYESTVPVRALAWAPHCDVGTLAFSSGTSNNELVVYSMGAGIKAVCDTGAEMFSLLWTRNSEIVVGWGNSTGSSALSNPHSSRQSRRPATPQPSGGVANTSIDNCIGIFELLSNETKLRRVAAISGHQSRVLHSTISWDGDMLVTGAGQLDATLRFWNITGSNAPFQQGTAQRMPTPPVSFPLFDDEFR